MTHLIKECYSKYTTKSENSTIRKQATRFKKWANFLRDTSQKKISRLQINTCKDAPQMSSGKLKQLDSTTHVSEWPKSTTLRTSNAAEEVEERQELSFNVKWCGHFGRQCGTFLQTQHTLTI